MKSIYICSVESYSGKSAVSLALALRYKEEGKAVGYIKPVGTLPIVKENLIIDEDVYTMYLALEKKDPLHCMSPIILSSYVTDKILGGEDINAMDKIKSSYSNVSEGKEIILIEGASTLDRGSIAGVSAYSLCKNLDLNIILTIKVKSISSIDRIISAKERLGDRLKGVVFLSIPRSKMENYENNIAPFLKKQGIDCLGLLPRDKILTAISVAQLEETLGARLLTAPKARDSLIEAFLVGAMGQERALRFFWRQPNKAVITGGDRADLQMAALETPTKCIILTGNLEPSPSVVGRAEELGVPLLLVEEDTWTTIEKIEKLTGRLTIEKPVQLARMSELMDEHFRYDLLDKCWKETH